MNLGKNIKYFRQKNELTQQQLGNLLHVTKVSICSYENSTRVPSLETLIKLSNIFKVTLDDLVKSEKYKS